MSTQVAAELRAAAAVLERDGWTQGEFIRDGGCKCVWGAINTVATGGSKADDEEMLSDEISEAERIAAPVKQLLRIATSFGLAEWNDAPGRTATEVITALRAAADRAEATR